MDQNVFVADLSDKLDKVGDLKFGEVDVDFFSGHQHRSRYQ
jgi:hypothetical protein